MACSGSKRLNRNPKGTPSAVLSNVTQVSEFKAFLWRHPEIHGLTRTEILISDIRAKMESIGKQFIFDGAHVTAQTLTQFKDTIQDSLQRMVCERRIQNFAINEPTNPVHPRNTLEIVIQPSLTVERVIVDLVINP